MARERLPKRPGFGFATGVAGNGFNCIVRSGVTLSERFERTEDNRVVCAGKLSVLRKVDFPEFRHAS